MVNQPPSEGEAMLARPSTIVISDWLANCQVGQWTPFEAATALKAALAKEGYLVARAASPPPSDAMREAWQPIETAPKDGTPMLLCHWESNEQDVLPIVSGFWSRLSEVWFSEMVGRNVKPTHWMPLPAPPALSQANESEK